MKRPKFWLRRLLFIGLLLVLGQYALLTWMVPVYGPRLLERLAGGAVTIDALRLTSTLTTTLTGVRLAGNTAEAALTIQGVTIRPRWPSLSSKTIRIGEVAIDEPVLRTSRTKAGTLLWPRLVGTDAQGTGPLPAWLSSWRVEIASVTIEDGVVEFVDEKLAAPFHGLVDHVTLNLGPVSMPPRPSQMSFALVGHMTGDRGHAAPLYCSGWLDLFAKNLQSSCRLEPLSLAAFEPYYKGPPEVRVYATTLSSTSQWSAKANEFKARVQLVLGHLTEGDLSVHGRAILDVKRLGSKPAEQLSGEITLTGMLDHPRDWQAAFLPGDDDAKHIMDRLQEHGVTLIKVAFVGHPLHINIAPAAQPVITDVAAATKEVQEALEILAAPPVVELEPASEEGVGPAEAPVPESAQPPATPAETPAAEPPEAPPVPTSDAVSPPATTTPPPASPTPQPAAPVEPASSVHP